MREPIATQHAQDLSPDEIDNQGLGYENAGWSDVRVTVSRSKDWKVYKWTGIHPVPSGSIDFVNVTSREPGNTELLEILADSGITGVKIDHFTEPYRFEDAFQIETLWYRQ